MALISAPLCRMSRKRPISRFRGLERSAAGYRWALGLALSIALPVHYCLLFLAALHKSESSRSSHFRFPDHAGFTVPFARP
ncbi:hypothetical protein JAAARDRAFT_29460 [Jaapia argillacea MUCL 33604]|uniref:Uncharacterized protein n=1 Tax=Jaapia argillacea MUCL 33604 TaxID=933084 RepID=A0A067Q8T4_9AGAM|nr:hypothetical protein JAAARDRAFT_29460 [Jaapia argillacea MUCL 33604]